MSSSYQVEGDDVASRATTTTTTVSGSLDMSVSSSSSGSASSLRAECDAFTEQFVSTAEDRVLAEMARFASKLRSSGTADRAVKAGDLAPSFELPDVLRGEMIRSNDLLRNGPLILNFYRGGR